MAEATPAKATARPARTRAAKTTTPAKVTPAKAATPAAEKSEETPAVVESAPANKRIIGLEPHRDGHTKSYTKWQYPAAEAGVTGTVYGPLGATEGKVLFVLPAETE
jgi:hypothetical protein